MNETHVRCCALCQAPLPGVARGVFEVACVYCGSHNRLLAAEAAATLAELEALRVAAKAADQIAREVDDLLPAAKARYEAALAGGDAVGMRQAMEGMLRLHQAPTRHIATSTGNHALMRHLDDALAAGLAAVDWDGIAASVVPAR
jgi:hypothetical protein